MVGIATEHLVGKPLPRKEDVALLTGTARFVNDLTLPGMLFARVLRSPYAHARIESIDVSKAREMPGVRDVLTGAELVGKVQPWGGMSKNLPFNDRFPFAVDRVIYEGQEVAAVVGENKWQTQDAIEAIEVDYEPLPAVVDPEQAMDPDAPRIHPEFGESNAWDHYELRVGDVDAADADVVIRQRFRTGRQGGAALEPHGCIADFDAAGGQLTLYSSTQMVHILRDALAEILRLPVANIRVVAPSVGGAFGSKADIFPWEVIASLFSMRLRRPVHLVLSREDVFRVGTCRCGQIRDAELHVKRDGTIVGYRDRLINDSGAVSAWGGQIMRIGTYMGLLPYPIPHVQVDGTTVATNTGPGGPVRGFGTPQTVWAKEQLIDMAADELGHDPVEMRLRNMPTSEECPYTTPVGHHLDSTSVHECLAKVAEEVGWKGRGREEPNVGVGFAVSLCCTGARHPSLDTDLATVQVTVGVDGMAEVSSGDVPHGQGHETFLSQIVGDTLGLGYEQVRVKCADTERAPFSLGTFADRTAGVSGTAAERAAREVRRKLEMIAAHVLQASVEELEIENGVVFVRGAPDRSMPFAALAGIAAYSTRGLPEGVEPGPIEAQGTYDTATEQERPDGGGNWVATWSAGAHAARVRVDPETGAYKVLDYVMAHDSGRVINPLIVDGQHHGGMVHGFGMVLGEDHIYASDGRMVNPSFGAYAFPTASDVPDLHRAFELPAPSTVIPGGQKGAGETATSPVPAAIGNALYDAIGVRFTALPITPERVLLSLREKERQRVESLRSPDDLPPHLREQAWGLKR